MIMFVRTIGYIFKKYIMIKYVLQVILMKNLNIAKKVLRFKNEFIITLN